ncbi:hypothetical protein YC2023_050850 [Brassica napus]
MSRKKINSFQLDDLKPRFGTTPASFPTSSVLNPATLRQSQTLYVLSASAKP